MRHSRPYLFSENDLRGTLDSQLQGMQQEIDRMNDDHLLNTGVEDMVTYLDDKYRVEPIVLIDTEITVDQAETQIDVSRDQDRYITDRSRPFHIKGTSNKYFVPFSGDVGLFKCQPSTYTSAPPIGVIDKNELVLTYDTTEHDAAGIKARFDSDLASIKQYVEWIEKDVTAFNVTIRSRAEQVINQRRDRILANRGLASSLGFPMRERAGVP